MAGKTYQRTFPASVEDVYAAAIRAIAEHGYAVTAAVSDAHVVSFNTGRSMKTWAGQDLTATVVPNGEGSRVILGGSLATRGEPRGGGSQLVGWGEKASIANRLLDAIAWIVDPKQVDDLEDDTEEIENLKAMRQAGQITAEDYERMRSFLLIPPDEN